LAVVGAFVTLLGWGVAACLFATTGGTFFGWLSVRSLAVGFLALPLLIWEQYSAALLMALDCVQIYNRGQVIGRTAGVVLVALASYLGWGVLGVLAALLISQAIVALFGIRFLIRRAGSIRPDRSTILALFRGAARLHPNYLGGFLMTSSSILIVNHFHGSLETGHYQTALQIVGLLLVVPQGASMVMYGQVTQLGPTGAWPNQRHVIMVLTLVTLGAAATLAVLARWAIHVVLGDEFMPAVGLSQILLLGVVGMTLATAMTSQWIGRGLLGRLSMVTVALGALSFATNLAVIPRFGAHGAAWVSVGIYALAAGAQCWLIVKCDSESRDLREPILEQL
jgi:O-antigen/teichoic acid export membrane protein